MQHREVMNSPETENKSPLAEKTLCLKWKNIYITLSEIKHTKNTQQKEFSENLAEIHQIIDAVKQ